MCLWHGSVRILFSSSHPRINETLVLKSSSLYSPNLLHKNGKEIQGVASSHVITPFGSLTQYINLTFQ